MPLYSMLESRRQHQRIVEMLLQSTCIRCGHCLAICPQNAITIDEYDMDEIYEYDFNNGHLDSQELLKSLQCRRSVRRYKKKSVEKELIEKIIEAGRYTPSGSNRQNVRYIVVEKEIPFLENEALKFYKKLFKVPKFIKKLVKFPFNMDRMVLEEGFLFMGGPILILVISENANNAALASMSMELMAESLGLGTLYVGLFTRVANKNKKIRKFLDLKKKENIVQCLVVGYPDVKYYRTAPKKKAIVQWR